MLRLHPRLAPVKVAVLPLVSPDGMPERARQIFDGLRRRIPAEFEVPAEGLAADLAASLDQP